MSGVVRGVARLKTCLCGWQWVAPEILGGARFTERADVYSFAMVAWEVRTLNSNPDSNPNSNPDPHPHLNLYPDPTPTP